MNMYRWFTLLVLPATIILSGCAKQQPKADADTARETLRTALAAWKKGEPIDALQGFSPSIYVTDFQWRGGFALLNYELSPKDQLFGPHLRCRVELSLQSPKGKTVKKKATYSVGTNGALTVMREDDY
jgi:hypothetical protein